MKKQIEAKPISVNICWQGRRFKTEAYKSYERELFILIGKAKETITEPVEIDYFFNLINANRTDLDNLIKPLQDIIVKLGYIKDDRQIQKMTAGKEKSKTNSISFEIKKLNED